jgi:hypothetical protein
MEPKFGFGEILKDKVTGFTGVCMGITFYATGCIHYGLALRKIKDDGTTHDWQWFDESRVEYSGDEKIIFAKTEKATSGIFPVPPSNQ